MCPGVVWSRLLLRTPELGAFFPEHWVVLKPSSLSLPLPLPLHFVTPHGQAHDRVLMLLTIHPNPSDLELLSLQSFYYLQCLVSDLPEGIAEEAPRQFRQEAETDRKQQ